MMSDFSEEAVPKLIDFGLTMILGPSQYTSEPFGTLGYVAPEVLLKRPYHFSCDHWSIGCLIYALLSGSLPFDHSTPDKTIKMTIHGPLVFDLPVWSTITQDAKEVIEGLLNKDPAERYTL